jgi:hypothetical protein
MKYSEGTWQQDPARFSIDDWSLLRLSGVKLNG